MDDTQTTNFPTYADLTQTQGWSRSAKPIGLDETAKHAISSSGSRYTHGEILGKGGMGTVSLARDARIGRDVAVKELHGEQIADEDRLRFMREARVQGQLEHPSIVPVYDIDERADGATFFTMRRVLGKTLHAILDERSTTGHPSTRSPSAGHSSSGSATSARPRTTHELLTAFATVCLTIDYAHSRGVVHRDIKPANIMLGDFGEVYVLDWGLARLVEETASHGSIDEPRERLSMTGALLGTPLYMAPEQMGDPEVGPAADVWALGAILFEILAHERLRDARSVYSPVDARTSVRVPDRNIAPELEAICVRATAEEPGARYPSARALQEAVAKYLEGDRDAAMRKEAAARHANTSDTSELLKAVALDPGNQDYVAKLGAQLSRVPAVLPAEVARKISDSEQTVVRTAARLSIVALLLWFACLPIVLAIGVRSVPPIIAILVPAALTIGLCAYAIRRPIIPFWVQTGMVIGTLSGAIATSRMYGPLVLMPTLIATFTIVLQAHPIQKHRSVAVWLGTIAIVVPILLELVGVFPHSYAFDGGRMSILPQMIALPEVPTSVFLSVASMAMVIVPGAFIRKLRVSLSEAEVQLMMQAWHLEQLTRRA